MSKTIKKFKETGKFSDAKHPGRVSKISSKAGRYLIKKVVDNPSITTEELKNDFTAINNMDISCKTIQNFLNNNDLKTYRPWRKPLLRKRMAKKRLEWAEEYKSKPIEFWKKVIWSDESRFTLNFSDKPQLIRRPKDASLSPKYIKPSLKFPKSIMVWGCFNSESTLSITLINGTLNSEKYINIIENNLMTCKNFDKETIFQQDNAPCHTSKKAKEWFEAKNIKTLKWPGNSPDLNPIENLWAAIKRKLIKKSPTNLAELKEAVFKIWNEEITHDFTEKLATSMPERINELLKNKGYHTHY